MNPIPILLGLALLPVAAAAHPSAPLYDPVALNIGINCQWQPHCIDAQRHAMKRALKYVTKYRPAVWRVQQCNRNAARSTYLVDWLGYDHCIHNAALQYVPPRPRSALRRRPHAPRKWRHRWNRRSRR